MAYWNISCEITSKTYEGPHNMKKKHFNVRGSSNCTIYCFWTLPAAEFSLSPSPAQNLPFILKNNKAIQKIKHGLWFLGWIHQRNLHTVLLATVQVDSGYKAAARSVPGQFSPVAGAARRAKEEKRNRSTKILSSAYKLLREKSIVSWLLSSCGARLWRALGDIHVL